MISKSDLEILSTPDALEILLRQEKLDFLHALRKTKYNIELRELQAELIQLQTWVSKNSQRVIIIFEGREFAGKGSAIRAFTDHLNPRNFRVVALPTPTDKQKGQWYFQRYVENLPESGELVFFDRSWYNRAMVEPVNGFCSDMQYQQFMKEVGHFERMLCEDGIIIVKFYMQISKQEQKNRIARIRKNPLRKWELTEVDVSAVKLWDKYTEYKDKMLSQTGDNGCPWTVVESDDDFDAHMAILKHVISVVPKK